MSALPAPRPREAAAPLLAPAPLRWRRLTDHAIRSTCERWQISRAGRAGIDETFSVWQRDPRTGRARLVQVCRAGAAAAKALAAALQAEADAR